MGNKNGVSGTRLYGIWTNMIQRCNNAHNHFYHRYGGRGIKVCDEWKNYYEFQEWAYANGYREYLTIDRIDNDKGYSPDNCRWATQKEQCRNTSKSIYIKIDGKRMNICEWADVTGIDVRTIRRRLKNGDTGYDLIRPKYEIIHSRAPLYEINGISKTANEWAQIIGITQSAFVCRWRKGWRGDNLLMPNRNHGPRSKFK